MLFQLMKKRSNHRDKIGGVAYHQECAYDKCAVEYFSTMIKYYTGVGSGKYGDPYTDNAYQCLK